jgi:hypothetical protein
MGVKMIGVFCDAIKNTEHVDPAKYVAGFQIIPDEIPGFGPIGIKDVKISMRVSAQMEKEIRAGKSMGLDVLLPEATNKLGGFSDACHTLTAATTVARCFVTRSHEQTRRVLRCLPHPDSRHHRRHREGGATNRRNGKNTLEDRFTIVRFFNV